MIEKALELKKTLRPAAGGANDFDRRPGFLASILTFLADVLLMNGHSRCCVDSEIYSMTSRSHWLR